MEFGTCCDNLGKAMRDPPSPLIRVEVGGTLFMAVGYARTDRGIAWFDHAVLYCPFCGAQLQTAEEIKQRADRYRGQGDRPPN